VTAIFESRDLSKLSTAALFGKLREHELELNKLKEQESLEKNTKSIALKNNLQNELSEEEENSGNNETLNLLTKRLNRFLKKKSQERTQPKRRYSKSNESNSSNHTCFGCEKPDHIKIDCPNNQSKDKQVSKKVERSKGNGAYIFWEDNEVSSSSDSSTESEEENMCFMVNNGESSYDLVSNYSNDSESYDHLLIAFKETHDEVNRLVVICNKLRSTNNRLEPKVKALENELNDAKTELVSLELMSACIY